MANECSSEKEFASIGTSSNRIGTRTDRSTKILRRLFQAGPLATVPLARSRPIDRYDSQNPTASMLNLSIFKGIDAQNPDDGVAD